MRTRIAGILNITPDSFHSESRCMTIDTIRSTALRIISEGADMIDIGACSTRPGSDPATEAEEWSRLASGMPTIRKACPEAVLSVDTFRPEIAARCIDTWGVDVINDVSGGNEAMYRTVAERGKGYVLTFPYGSDRDIISDMMSFFHDRLEQLGRAGGGDLILDPGFGFGKQLQQNYAILANLGRLSEFGLPIMVGMSRKSMAYRLLGTTPEESLEATCALNALAVAEGAAWLRVHDVKEAVQTALLAETYNNLKNG